MDIIQILIVSISLILTALVVFLGYQVWLILKEIRISLQKMNKMLDDMTKVSGMVGNSAENIGGIVNGIKAGFSIFSGLNKGEDNE